MVVDSVVSADTSIVGRFRLDNSALLLQTEDGFRRPLGLASADWERPTILASLAFPAFLAAFLDPLLVAFPAYLVAFPAFQAFHVELRSFQDAFLVAYRAFPDAYLGASY